MGKWKHRISNIDEMARTADCANCGSGVPVRLRKNPSRWVCKLSDGRSLREKDHHAEGRWKATRERLSEEQGGKCAICDRRGQLVLDHCHETGKVRSALCTQCNVAIGMLGDDPETIRKAAAYVEEHARK